MNFYIIYLGILNVNCDFQLKSVTTAITAMTIFLWTKVMSASISLQYFFFYLVNKYVKVVTNLFHNSHVKLNSIHSGPSH
jgi:hypothetical protein